MEGLNYRGLPGFGVDLDDLASGDVVEVHLVASTVLGAVGRVVIDADDLFGPVLRSSLESGVVLERELYLVAHLEVGGFARQLPDNLAGLAVNLVSSIGVAGRDQVVALIVLVY